ncbi:glucosyltransferase domain-containing protein [Cronobacter malonaticus]
MREYLRKDDALLALSLLAIILPFYNSFPYLDDMVRLTYNYTGLIVQGRYLTEWFYTAMQGMKYTTFPDIYGFNLLFIAVSFLILKRYILDKQEFLNASGLLFILCILSSPFLLENLSYHIDSIGMFSSLMLSIASASIKQSRFDLRVFISTVILFIATCFYQFSLNVYICTVAIISLWQARGSEEKSLLLFILSKVVALFVALVIYMLVMRIYATDTYVDSHATLMTVEELKSGILYSNIVNINNIIESAFSPYYSVFFAVLMMLAAVGMVAMLTRSIANRRFVSAACIVTVPVVTILMIYLPAASFSRPIVQPRILIAYGFFIFVMLSMAMQVNALKKAAIGAVVAMFAINIMTASAFNKAQVFAITSTKNAMERIYSATPERYRDSNGELNVTFTNLYNHGMEFERNMKYFPVLEYLVRDPQKSPFLMNGVNRYFRTGVKPVSGGTVTNCEYIGMASPWIYLSSCDAKSINVTFKNYY